MQNILTQCKARNTPKVHLGSRGNQTTRMAQTTLRSAVHSQLDMAYGLQETELRTIFKEAEAVTSFIVDGLPELLREGQLTTVSRDRASSRGRSSGDLGAAKSQLSSRAPKGKIPSESLSEVATVASGGSWGQHSRGKRTMDDLRAGSSDKRPKVSVPSAASLTLDSMRRKLGRTPNQEKLYSGWLSGSSAPVTGQSSRTVASESLPQQGTDTSLPNSGQDTRPMSPTAQSAVATTDTAMGDLTITDAPKGRTKEGKTKEAQASLSEDDIDGEYGENIE